MPSRTTPPYRCRAVDDHRVGDRGQPGCERDRVRTGNRERDQSSPALGVRGEDRVPHVQPEPASPFVFTRSQVLPPPPRSTQEENSEVFPDAVSVAVAVRNPDAAGDMASSNEALPPGLSVFTWNERDLGLAFAVTTGVARRARVDVDRVGPVGLAVERAGHKLRRRLVGVQHGEVLQVVRPGVARPARRSPSRRLGPRSIPSPSFEWIEFPDRPSARDRLADVRVADGDPACPLWAMTFPALRPRIPRSSCCRSHPC